MVCRADILHNTVFVQYTTFDKSFKYVVPVFFFFVIMCTGIKGFC